MEVSCLMSSYCFCNAQLFITNPNPETAFFQKSDKPQPCQHVLLTPIWICAFLHAYSPHPTPHPHPALFLGIFFSLMHLKLFIIFCFIYHDFRCNKCLPFQLCSSWKVLSPWRGDILFFICTHPPPTRLPLPPSLRVSFWIVGLRYYLDPSDRVRLRPRVFLTPLYYYVTFTYALKTPTK